MFLKIGFPFFGMVAGEAKMETRSVRLQDGTIMVSVPCSPWLGAKAKPPEDRVESSKSGMPLLVLKRIYHSLQYVR